MAMKFNKAIMVGELNLNNEYRMRLNENAIQVLQVKDLENIEQASSDADALLVGFGTKVSRDVIDRMPNLKYIGVYATAYEFIDINYAKTKNITVCNLGGYSTEAVAEFVFSVLLDNMRNIDRAKERARAGDNAFIVSELIKNREIKDKVFAVFGAGNIGGRVAEIAIGFGANVMYWSRNRKPHLETKGVRYKDPDALIPVADILSLHLAVTKETEGVMTGERIKAIKPSAILVSTVGLGLIDIDALDQRLAKNDITFIIEDPGGINDQLKKLSKHRNCIVYPPVTLTYESLLARQIIFIGNIEAFLDDRLQNKVN